MVARSTAANSKTSETTGSFLRSFLFIRSSLGVRPSLNLIATFEICATSSQNDPFQNACSSSSFGVGLPRTVCALVSGSSVLDITPYLAPAIDVPMPTIIENLFKFIQVKTDKKY